VTKGRNHIIHQPNGAQKQLQGPEKGVATKESNQMMKMLCKDYNISSMISTIYS